MIKYFEWGRKGGCIISDNRNEAYNKLNEMFSGNIHTSEEDETVAGFTEISFIFYKEIEPSKSVKNLLKAVK